MTNPESVGTPDNPTAGVVADVLRETLQLSDGFELNMETQLLGDIPELDSMAVVTILTSLEEHFDFFIDDSDVSAETFETFGALVQFVDNKLSA